MARPARIGTLPTPASPDDRSIDVQIGRLRRKIEPRPERPVLVKTVRGAGYIFTPPVADR